MGISDRSIADSIDGASSADNAVFHRLNLNLLYSLDAILHAPNLTEAGRRVSLGQSAMSHALRRLREHFEDDLRVLIDGEWQLTALGQALRSQVRRAMREVEATLNLSIAFDPLTTTRTITIAATETAEQLLLGPVLRGLSDTAPGLTVNLLPLNSEDPQRSLDRGADMLLLPGEMAIDGLETTPFLTDSVSCLVWNRHPVLRDSICITEPQYRVARHIVARGEAIDAFAAQPSDIDMLRARRICVRTTSQAALPAIIIGSDLVATGSTWLFQYYAAVMPLRVVEVPFARRDSTIVAQWPRHRQDPMLTWFLSQIKGFHGRHYTV